MKILSIRLKNLNSLAGEWHIDFTAPQYESEGIFLITGPTGSGKTTILDAICLALYGRTPRQKSFSNNINEMMPGDQRDCMAEVTFEAGGARYRSMWSHKRTGGKAQNPFTTPQLLLENADTGDALGKNEEAKKRIQKIIAMNFEQFTRSMLLAQGNFAAFLQSRPNERAEILEQITGTEIYSRISTEVFNLEKIKRDEIKFRQMEIDGIEILDEKALAELTKQQLENEAQENELSIKLERQKELVNWKKKLLKLETEMDKIFLAERELQAEDQAFESAREKLALANRAMAIEAAWALLKAVRNALMEQKAKLAACEKSLPKFQLLREKAAESLDKLTMEREKADSDLLRAREMFQRVQGMDSMIRDKEKSLRTCEDDLKKQKEKLAQFKSELKKINENLAKREAEAGELDKWLNVNARIENIAQELPFLERSISEINAIKKYIKDKKFEIENRHLEYQNYKRGLAGLVAQIEELVGEGLKIEEKRRKLLVDLKNVPEGNTLADLRVDLENLYIKKQERLILNREDICVLRASLQDDSPCPVCGALHHPYAVGQIPAIDELDREINVLSRQIKAASDIESKLAECDKEENYYIITIKDREIEKNRQEAQIQFAKSKLIELNNDVDKESERLSNLEDGCKKILADFDLNPENNMEDAISTLQGMLENWKSRQNIREGIKNNIIELKTALNGNEIGKKQTEDGIIDLESKHRELHADFDRLVLERQEEFGNLDKDFVNGLEQKTRRLKNAEEDAKIEDKRADRDLTICQKDMENLQDRLEGLEKECEERSRDFLEELEREKFANEDDFLSARLGREQRDNLHEKDKILQERKVRLYALKAEKEKELKTEQERQETMETLDKLEEEQQKLRESLNQVTQNAVIIKAKLQANAENIEKAGDKREELELLKKDHLVYAELNDLIGQQNGDKFRKFAQGLTLEILIAHANRELKKMNDRYLLLIDRNKALELNISDNYKAGEIRTSSNLSGGESFIVSLALALGLASLSSNKTQLDSLFLDEGFGTLDEDSLETTLATLENLKHEGKLIGIISHVGLLRDRINTQIQLSGTGGRSIMKGPGCSRA